MLKFVKHLSTGIGSGYLLLAIVARCLIAPPASCHGGEAAPSSDVRDRVAREDVVVQLHRGAGRGFPENTLPACEEAWRRGAVPECDVRTSKDGVLCAFHDPNFARVVKNAPPDLQGKGAKDLTWDELSRLDVGAFVGDRFAGQRIAKIADVFAAMRDHPRRQVYLDLKDKDVSLEKLASLARQYGVERQIISATTHYDQLCQWKKLSPQSQTLLWMSGRPQVLAKRIDDLKKVDFQGVSQLQIHVKAGNLAADDPFTPSSAFLRATARELRKRNILFQTFPTPPNSQDPQVYVKLMQLGVESFATDYPDETMRAIDLFYQQRSPKTLGVQGAR